MDIKKEMMTKYKKILNDPNTTNLQKQKVINEIIHSRYIAAEYLLYGDLTILNEKQYKCLLNTILTTDLVFELMESDFQFTEKQRMIALSTIILKNRELLAIDNSELLKITSKERYRLFRSVISQPYKLNLSIKYTDIQLTLKEVKAIIYTLLENKLPIDTGILLYSKYKDVIDQLDPEFTGPLDAKIVTYQLNKY
jgi:hypothetical protein